jgi:heme-degrading monooxygenase HmoA
MHVKPDRMIEFQRLYEENAVPALEQQTRCRYAALVQNIQNNDEAISLTLWDNKDDCVAYEESGIYSTLIEQSKHFFIDGEEMRLHLTADAQLELAPVTEEPVIKSYTGGDAPEMPGQKDRPSSFMFVRLVKMIVRPGMEQEFIRTYQEVIRPELLRLPGCREAYVMKDLDEENDWISMTIWSRKEDADNHEEGGSSARLRAKLTPLLSGLYQWKRGVEKNIGKQAITSDDVTVTGYRVLTGKRLGR